MTLSWSTFKLRHFHSENTHSSHNLPVAIYGMDDFDVEAIDVDTIAFGDLPLVEAGATPVGPTLYSYGDISGDGIAGLSRKFSMWDIKDHGVFDVATMEAELTGELFDSTEIVGKISSRLWAMETASRKQKPFPSPLRYGRCHCAY